ncbi:hypothetical protein KZ483_16965 [Paenibacillus sp. sptzw28]|uniref:hypothetical protein n=1 Tax=Paenibacillus sp. sptzw28 TaxID=715179 RepID=UPI001C6F2E29|nr:hypothetical protein [Paenibacillus sp. sptzw28]QYR19589.1 hypothetical protein KZ483_16965 [Paenibacillus sp. sptzw28]
MALEAVVASTKPAAKTGAKKANSYAEPSAGRILLPLTRSLRHPCRIEIANRQIL